MYVTYSLLQFSVRKKLKKSENKLLLSHVSVPFVFQIGHIIEIMADMYQRPAQIAK